MGTSKPDSKMFKTVGLTSAQWAWLEQWAISDVENPTECLGELVDRAMKFWPSGPNKFR